MYESVEWTKVSGFTRFHFEWSGCLSEKFLLKDRERVPEDTKRVVSPEDRDRCLN